MFVCCVLLLCCLGFVFGARFDAYWLVGLVVWILFWVIGDWWLLFWYFALYLTV